MMSSLANSLRKNTSWTTMLSCSRLTLERSLS